MNQRLLPYVKAGERIKPKKSIIHAKLKPLRREDEEKGKRGEGGGGTPMVSWR